LLIINRVEVGDAERPFNVINTLTVNRNIYMSFSYKFIINLMVMILMGKPVLWGLLILFTVAVSLNSAAAANNSTDSMWLTIHDLHGDTNLTDSMELSAADNSTSDTPDTTGVL